MSERIVTAVVCVGVGIGVGVGLKVWLDSRTDRDTWESHNHDHLANDRTSPTGNGSRGMTNSDSTGSNDSGTGVSPSETGNPNNARARYDTEVIYDQVGSMSIEDAESENVNIGQGNRPGNGGQPSHIDNADQSQSSRNNSSNIISRSPASGHGNSNSSNIISQSPASGHMNSNSSNTVSQSAGSGHGNSNNSNTVSQSAGSGHGNSNYSSNSVSQSAGSGHENSNSSNTVSQSAGSGHENSNSSNTVSQSAGSGQGHTPQNNSSNTGIQSSSLSQRHVPQNNNSNSRHTPQNNYPNHGNQSLEIESLQTDGGPPLSDLDGSFGRENSVPETDSTPFTSNFLYDAVILHADDDEQLARECHRMLSEDGAAIAFIDDLIPPGSYVTSGMANLLESCRLVIVFHTRNFNEDGLLEYGKHANLKQCLEHIDHNKRNRVIPCLADDTELSQDLRTFQYIDFNDEFFSRRMSILFQHWRDQLP